MTNKNASSSAQSDRNLILGALKESPVIPPPPDKQHVALSGKIRGAHKIDWKQIPKATWELKHELLDWTNRDLAIYLRKLCEEKFQEPWGLNIVGVITYMDRLRDSVVDAVGFCDNLVMRDYIDYYFREFALLFKDYGDRRFSVKPMRFAEPLAHFADQYDYMKSAGIHLTPEHPSTPSHHDHYQLTGDNLNNAYLLGADSLILGYGFVASLNWLVLCKEYSSDDALSYIVEGARQLSKKQLRIAAVVTGKLAPYPDISPVQNVKELLHNALSAAKDLDWNERYSATSKWRI